ncbi:MAG: hypothetical protein AAF495_20165 [Pseudomonadota bacterium]
MSAKLAISIGTRDRVPLLRTMARSLREVEGLEHATIRVYDDCSENLSRDEIAGILPEAAEVQVNEQRLGADRNMHAIYRDFLASGDDLLFSVDSDLVLHPGCLQVIETLMPETDGILSLYNSRASAPVERLALGGHRLVQKSALGSAGVIFGRDLLARVIEEVPASGCYDIDWSHHLHEAGVRLLVTEQSYVQHLGVMEGFNAGRGIVEFGLNFEPGNRVNEAILAEAFNQVILDERNGLQAAFERVQNSYSFRVGNAILHPLRQILIKLSLYRGRF